MRFKKCKMIVSANAAEGSNRPKAEAFSFILMVLINKWLLLKVWKWNFNKSFASAKWKHFADWNFRFMFFECELWQLFLFWLLLHSPWWWTCIPLGFLLWSILLWGLPGAEFCRPIHDETHKAETRTLSDRHRSVTGCYIPLPTTSIREHIKEEKGGMGRASWLQTHH